MSSERKDWRDGFEKNFCYNYCMNAPDSPNLDDCNRCMIDAELARICATWWKDLPESKFKKFAHCVDDTVMILLNWSARNYNTAYPEGGPRCE